MSFTLEITFKCLCYFVPDERGDAPRMHVLLPSTNGHVHDDGNAAHAGHAHGRGGVYASQADPPAVEAHVARLMFPRSGGKLADGGNGRFLEVEEGGNGIVDFEPLEGFTIELPAGGGALVPALPAEVMRRGPVKTAVLDQPAHPDVVSRLVLNAGRATEQKSPAIWSFLGEERPLAQEVVWTIPDLEGNALTWRLVSLNGGEDKPLPDVPANEHGLVPITIKHVTASEFPNSSSERHPDDNAAHVGAFDALLEAPLQNGVPLFVRRREARTITCLTGGS